MVELQSRASLVNASALCAMEQEVKGDGVNVITEISAELQRERQRNAQLMERILILEAQIKEKDKDSLLNDGHANVGNSVEKSFKNFKRQKVQQHSDKVEDGNIGISIELASQMRNITECEPIKEANGEHHLVNWMSMDETQFMHSEIFRDGDSAADCDDRDDSDNTYEDAYVEDDIDINQKDREHNMNLGAGNRSKDHLREECADEGIHIMCMEGSSDGKNEPSFPNVNKDQKKFYLLPDSKPDNNIRINKKHDKKESSNIGEYVPSSKLLSSDQKVFHEGSGSISLYKKSPKVAFCPKEVKRIIDSKALVLKNAQSHTIRKIIVFAFLAIRHGCEDMYELDFNHFSILRKGEPYVSPKDPGEHVLYENPGVQRKVFYPNHQNPTLCPVHILEEEKAMRPPDACCPSCLFLCIKYGGRTRNLPQNEYVRQRMGRNKLKSFGPAMCLMAMLVHIRSGSFFFKALGITLLFMAGFPDDMVRRETKYRNLDLLQKYYRTDEDAEGEELLFLRPVTSDTQASPSSLQLTGKLTSTKLKGKKQTNSIIKPHNVQRSSVVQSASLSSAFPTQFGLMGYTSIHAHAMSPFQSTPSQTLADGQPISNPAIVTPAHNVSYTNQTPYCMFPPQPANAFMPMMYWPPPNAFPNCPYTSSYGYQPFPSSGNYMSIQPQPYYSHPSCNPFISKVVQGSGKDDVASEEGDSDSDSSSSSTEPKEALQSCQE